jgi:ubiquinone biosynthesis protein
LRRRLESLGSTYTFHRAVTVAGEAVVLKVMRSGIRNSIETDLRLLGMLGNLLQRLIPRYQPKRIVADFSAYTAREVDFAVEADNAETFAANFADMPAVRVGGDTAGERRVGGGDCGIEYLRGHRSGIRGSTGSRRERRNER